MKIIQIITCRDCPHNDHQGGFGNPSCKPICRKANREQPWEPAKGYGSMIVAVQSVDIPDWCPLEGYTPPPAPIAEQNCDECAHSLKDTDAQPCNSCFHLHGHCKDNFVKRGEQTKLKF